MTSTSPPKVLAQRPLFNADPTTFHSLLAISIIQARLQCKLPDFTIVAFQVLAQASFLTTQQIIVFETEFSSTGVIRKSHRYQDYPTLTSDGMVMRAYVKSDQTSSLRELRYFGGGFAGLIARVGDWTPVNVHLCPGYGPWLAALKRDNSPYPDAEEVRIMNSWVPP
jgi:hypothetical protein